MTSKRTGLPFGVLVITAVCLIASFAHAAPVVTTDSTLDKSVTATTDELYYAGDVSTTDLLAGVVGTHTGWNNKNGAVDVGLNDGSPGGDYDGLGNSFDALIGAAWAMDSGTSSVYVLGAGDGAGYDITEIQSIAAWTSGSGFPNQKYNISVRYLGDTTYTALTSVDYQPFPGTTAADGGSTKVNVTDDTGILAGGIDAIKFDFLTTTDVHSSASTVFREIDVFGTPTSGGVTSNVIYAESFDGSGGALNGKAPTTGSGTWIANTIATDDGVVSTTAQGSAVLPVTLAINQTYTVTMDITETGASTGWVGLGFATAAPTATAGADGGTGARFTNNVPGVAWILDNHDTNTMVAYEGPKAGTTYYVIDDNGGAGWPAGTYTVSVVLDTTGDGSTFTADFFVNGTSITGGPQLVDAVALSAITHVGFTLNNNDCVTYATVDNFSLTLNLDPTAPGVTIVTPDMISWSGESVALDATVVNNDDGIPQADLTYNWSTNAPAGYTVAFVPSAAVEDSTVTITKDAATGDATVVTVTLAANNVGSSRPDVTASMKIDLYDDACDAAIAKDPFVIDLADINNDCITDVNDLAQIAAAWLDEYALESPVPASPSEPLRIMPLGDSITAGYTDNSNDPATAWTVPFEFGYRSGLYTRLTNAGYNFHFVGESVEPWAGPYQPYPTNTPTLDLRPLGQDKHRGYGGKTILETNSGVAGYIANDNPDIILLLIGINGNTNRANPAELEILVNTIFTADPDVYLVVAQITPYHPDYNDRNIDYIIPYNTYIRDTLVPTRAAQGYNISTVDMYSLFLSNPADLTSVMTGLHSNNINHPTNPVYDQMAQVWFEELERIILK